MCDLFLAGFNRLWRSRVFQICCLVSLLGNAAVVLSSAYAAMRGVKLGFEQMVFLDDLFFSTAPVLGVMCAAFVSLFIGTEHSDGVMRNMLVVGRARWEIYLANYAVCFVGTAAFLVCWFLGGLVGIPIVGAWRDLNGLLLRCAVLLLCSASFTGIFCLLSMLCTNRAVAAVLALLLAIGLLMWSSYMLNALNQPEFQQGMVMTEAGLQLSEPTPNPSYVGGMKREVFQFLSDTLPSGQSISVCSYELNRPVLSLASSVVIAVLSSAVGMIFFKRKDLR